MFGGLGGWMLYDSTTTVMRSTEAAGTVVDFEVRRTTSQQKGTTTSYHPVVEFSTPDGAPVRFTDPSPDSSLRRGERVVVLYEANMPTKARIYTTTWFWVAPAILVVIGLAAPVAAVLWDRKKKRDLLRAAFS